MSDIFGIRYSLCQKLTLKIGSNYSFYFDVVKPKRVASATANAYLNSVFLVSNTSTDYLVSTKVFKNFTATQTANVICINGSFVHSNISKKDSDDYSPFIDNVTVIEIIKTVTNTSTNTSTNISNATNMTINTNTSINTSINTSTNSNTSPNSSSVINTNTSTNNNNNTISNISINTNSTNSTNNTNTNNKNNTIN